MEKWKEACEMQGSVYYGKIFSNRGIAGKGFDN